MKSRSLPRIIQITDIHEEDAFAECENIVGTVMAPTTIEQTQPDGMYGWSYIVGKILKSQNDGLDKHKHDPIFYAVKYKVLFK